jgi:hypothetical protein
MAFSQNFSGSSVLHLTMRADGNPPAMLGSAEMNRDSTTLGGLWNWRFFRRLRRRMTIYQSAAVSKMKKRLFKKKLLLFQKKAGIMWPVLR